MEEFRKHPTSVCMTYVEHLRLSLSLSTMFFMGGWKAIIHAFFPFWYVKSSTQISNQIRQHIQNSGCNRSSM